MGGISFHQYIHDMEDSTQFITKEKQDQLKDELRTLKEKEMPEIANRIDEARQMGDLSENAEYHAAREQLAWAQSRVKEVDFILQNAELIAKVKGGGDTVTLGATITVSVNKKERVYTIVGAQEADPLNGKISNESPLGEAFIGRKKGDNVDVEIPSGTQTYTVVSID